MWLVVARLLLLPFPQTPSVGALWGGWRTLGEVSLACAQEGLQSTCADISELLQIAMQCPFIGLIKRQLQV